MAKCPPPCLIVAVAEALQGAPGSAWVRELSLVQAGRGSQFAHRWRFNDTCQQASQYLSLISIQLSGQHVVDSRDQWLREVQFTRSKVGEPQHLLPFVCHVAHAVDQSTSLQSRDDVSNRRAVQIELLFTEVVYEKLGSAQELATSISMAYRPRESNRTDAASSPATSGLICTIRSGQHQDRWIPSNVCSRLCNANS